MMLDTLSHRTGKQWQNFALNRLQQHSGSCSMCCRGTEHAEQAAAGLWRYLCCKVLLQDWAQNLKASTGSH